MKRIVTAALCVLTFMSFGVKAELVHTDWKVDGDSASTLDTSTGLEWLKAQHTEGMSFSEVDAELETSLLGWRWATTDEVAHLFANNLSYLSERFIKNKEGESDANDRDAYEETADFARMIDGPQTYAAFSSYFILRNDNDLDGSLLSLNVNWRYDSYRASFSGNEITYENGFVAAGNFLVSDGGTTLSSQLDPTININNPNAPVNQVSVPFLVGGLTLLFLGIRRRS